jgi:hypothetical protein
MKPLVDGSITTIKTIHQEASMLFYPAALPLSSRTVVFTAGVIRRHRVRIGSPWRKLNPSEQALLVLAYLRKGETFADLAAGFGVGTATAWRYVTETVGLLAARSPKLRKALRDAKQAGHAYVVIDGTVIPIDRVAADRPFYSGKHHRHGMNLQVISSPDGDIVWVSGALPGAVHDLTAARHRSGSAVQDWGTYSSRSISACPCREAYARNTPTWQFSVRPAVPEYCLWTPADRVPFFRKPVSSAISTPSGSPSCSTT